MAGSVCGEVGGRSVREGEGAIFARGKRSREEGWTERVVVLLCGAVLRVRGGEGSEVEFPVRGSIGGGGELNPLRSRIGDHAFRLRRVCTPY
jgi:hypothetical protein